MTQVLDKGFVRLDGSLADDLSVVNSARVSLHNHHEEMEENDEGLIRFLMRERHGTPFEHNIFRFHVKLPLFVIREWQRHRIASYNEWSGRYSTLEPHFYIPERVRTQEGKPGAYTFVDFPLDRFSEAILENIKRSGEEAYMEYERMLQAGVAREQARLVLPLNIYTEMYFTSNARSLMNFLSLRNSPQAMFEIREYAKAVETFFKEKMPITHAAFIENGRVAP